MIRPVRAAGTSMAVAALLVSSAAARRREVGRTEERIFRVINGAPDRLHLPVWALMQAGSLAAVFVASAVLRRSGRPQLGRTALVAGVVVWAGVKAVKPLIGRGRPDRHLDLVSVRGPEQSGLGYPSGHMAVVTTLTIISGSHLRPGGRLLVGALAVTTGGARIYVGAHLPLDVIGGAAIGFLGGRAANALLTTGGTR